MGFELQGMLKELLEKCKSLQNTFRLVVSLVSSCLWFMCRLVGQIFAFTCTETHLDSAACCSVGHPRE